MSTVPRGYDSDFDPLPDQRVSGLAISSLVTGILCCIPGVGLLAMILGLSSMLAISRSDGRLSGRGMAIAGMVLGAVGSLWTMMLGLGTYSYMSAGHRYGMTYQLIEKKDYAGVRARLSPVLVKTITDEQLADFHDRVSAEFGNFQGTPKGLADWFNSLLTAAKNSNQTAAQPNNSLAGNIMPVPLKFDKGVAFVVFQMDRSNSGGVLPRAIENIVVFTPSGRTIWLVEPAGGSPTTPPAAPTPKPDGEKPSAPGAPPPSTPEGSAPPPPPPSGG
jgi:hypothetical protein